MKPEAPDNAPSVACEIGGAYVSITLSRLDDIEPSELAEVPVKYMDGRPNNWWNELAVTRHL